MSLVEKKIYHLVNSSNSIRVKCTEKYLPHWLARGFEVEFIEFKNVDLSQDN